MSLFRATGPRASRDPHLEQPRSDRVRHPDRTLLYRARPTARAVIRRRYRVELHHADRVPRRGGVIFAANHVGVLDGPLLAIFAPRPVHALTKLEMFVGRMGRLLTRSGQIPLDRFHPDPRAVRTSLRVLRDGYAVGIFPEGGRGSGELQRFHRGAAYLAMVTGAPVVPVIMIGTREPGGHLESTPPRGSRIDMVFGEPFRLDARPWPRTQQAVEQASRALRERMLADLAEAKRLTGRELPGPLPAGERELDGGDSVTEAST